MSEQNSGAYFVFNSDVFLVNGAKRAALYNLSDGEIYSIDPTSTKIVEGCEAGRTISDISANIDEITRDQVAWNLKYLFNVCNNRLAKSRDMPYPLGRGKFRIQSYHCRALSWFFACGY